ncbi:hypothetical protein BBB39_15300 [Bordetella trematum]|uniref:Uncharacterized protein n=1 Tax=Bordetella trematum TaxID=123899 RepID=A0A157S6Z9_9BORD|nr:hypothetical protein [Bordetella trematum]AZR94973.1 hypothetical protein BBB39_15300 [Bordetella trematum]NNH18498.1 hypothetical protein [Bordetella trematum]SAI36698.1 Uncharacterised protein [Bordetella trematum]SAI66184.1 Uncharacterised protein [Bordetella trematum]SUV96723.1 Uncharacterised protein [Bordetella trematum]
MTRYIALERGQIPADDIKPGKRADSSPNRRVMRMIEKGEEFTFHGKPGKWMKKVDSSDQNSASGNETGRKPGRQASGQKSASENPTPVGAEQVLP